MDYSCVWVLPGIFEVLRDDILCGLSHKVAQDLKKLQYLLSHKALNIIEETGSTTMLFLTDLLRTNVHA